LKLWPDDFELDEEKRKAEASKPMDAVSVLFWCFLLAVFITSMAVYNISHKQDISRTFPPPADRSP
jgi:hypothetical protein